MRPRGLTARQQLRYDFQDEADGSTDTRVAVLLDHLLDALDKIEALEERLSALERKNK